MSSFAWLPSRINQTIFYCFISKRVKQWLRAALYSDQNIDWVFSWFLYRKRLNSAIEYSLKRKYREDKQINKHSITKTRETNILF